MVSSFSSVSDDLLGSERGSPVSVHPTNTPRLSNKKTGMDLFHNAKAVRLRSHHDKYLLADEDEESVTQDRNGSSKNACWTVEFVDGADDNFIRLKSLYGKYLTASNQPFLLGMTGRKLKTRYGHFLRANGGLPPWRNSITHDIPQRTATQGWILWDVHIVEILVIHSPHPKPPPPPLPAQHLDSFVSESILPSTHSIKSDTFSRQESSDSLVSSPPKADGRTIFYHVADEFGGFDDGVEGFCITFKGKGVDELTRRLEEETGLDDIVVCSPSPLNGELNPLRLQLPPNNVTMHVVVVPSSSKVARDFAKAGFPL
ncbi:hypothetical protein F0562_032852 [Nyssa sinensis]|uniref:Uncharacterized protein n=1 Tax=Nyssa sinensis TaxID=561372 RepID=A0A5J5AVJ5_9ASTE|nr:hypothetical protein F0562_032852 [Nyssa sinensis]